MTMQRFEGIVLPNQMMVRHYKWVNYPHHEQVGFQRRDYLWIIARTEDGDKHEDVRRDAESAQ